MSQLTHDTDASSVGLRLAQLAASVDALAQQQRQMLEGQQFLAEAWREAAPILKDVMSVATTRLGDLEQRGYFRAGRAAVDVLDRVVSAYDGDELQRFSDAVVSILDTVRNLTQPEILAIANEASAALSGAAVLPPIGMAGMLRASRDGEVQKGMAVVLELLRHVGRASAHLAPGGTAAPAARPQARTSARRPAPARGGASGQRTPRAAGAPAAATAPAMEEVTFMGARFLADGTLLEPEKWTREMGSALAATVGVAEMTDQHWKVVDFARTEYGETNHSPNIRRLTEGAGIDTRRLYTLFPQAPGRAVARVAGLPKPAGCI